MRTSAFAALALGVGSLSGCDRGGRAPEAVLRFAAIPDENTTDLRQKFEPVARHLSEALNMAVEYVPAGDVDAVAKKFESGGIQLVWIDGFAGIELRRAVPGALAIAQGVEDSRQFSYLIAHRSTGLEYSDEFPQGIREFSFTFGSSQSTSGRLMPEFFIRRNTGRDVADFFGREVKFSGSHRTAIERVAAGKCGVGAVSSRVYDEMVVDGRVDPDECRVIWKTPPYHDYGFTVHPEVTIRFGNDIVDRLRDALLGIADPELLEGFGRSAFIPAEEADYADLIEAARQIDMTR